MRESSRRTFAACAAAVVAVALSACNGGGVGSPNNVAAGPNALPPTTAMTSSRITSDALSPIRIYPGEVVGQPNMFRPKVGDMKTGGRGAKVAHIPCDATEYISDYHIHMYLGLIYNGTQIAIPRAIGMIKPGAPTNGYVSTAKCFYWIHTHDSSGLLHIEDPNKLPPSAAIYKLSSFLSIWGVPHSALAFGPFKGHIHVFVGNPAALGQTQVSTYARYKGSYENIVMRSHEVVWIEIGKPYYEASQLPPVTFYTEY